MELIIRYRRVKSDRDVIVRKMRYVKRGYKEINNNSWQRGMGYVILWVYSKLLINMKKILIFILLSFTIIFLNGYICYKIKSNKKAYYLVQNEERDWIDDLDKELDNWNKEHEQGY